MTDRPIIFGAPMVRAVLAGTKTQTRRLAASPFRHVREGDRLWVRETWGHDAPSLDDCRRGVESDGPSYGPYYRATAGKEDLGTLVRWRPSIHMPRWASRIALEVVGVRCEPLRAIGDEDAMAEGATMRPRCFGSRGRQDGWSMDWSVVGRRDRFGTDGRLTEADVALESPRWAFANYWTRLYGKPGELWDDNPEVIVIAFRRSPDET
jgi:hypothetical protein